MAADTLESRSSRQRWLLAAAIWLLFWTLLAAVAVQEHWRNGQHDVWRPLLWEGSSCLVVTAIAWLMWRVSPNTDRWLGAPARWFAIHLAPLPLIAPLFVALVFTLRHTVHDALGTPYRHGPWGEVLVYESIKFTLFYALFTGVFFGLRSNRAMAIEQLRAERALLLSRQAQLLQLAQQIEAHFLFNALNTIASTIHSDPHRADALLMRLAALLRAATDLSRRPFSTLADELQLLEGYAAIMGERFADRVQIEFQIEPGARDCKLPALALQPLLENAFRHGVEREPSPARVCVQAQRRGGRLRIEVRCSVGQVPAAVQPGVGLTNLKERLQAAYGEQAELRLESGADGRGSVAWIEMPCAC